MSRKKKRSRAKEKEHNASTAEIDAIARLLHAEASRLKAKARLLHGKTDYSAGASGTWRDTFMKAVQFSIVLLTAIFAGLQAFAALGWL